MEREAHGGYAVKATYLYPFWEWRDRKDQKDIPGMWERVLAWNGKVRVPIS